MSKNFFCATPMGKRLTMSIPHCANDQGLVIGLRASKGTWGMGVSLTLITFFDIVFNVLLHGGPIVSLCVGVVCQSSSTWVIVTYVLIEFG